MAHTANIPDTLPAFNIYWNRNQSYLVINKTRLGISAGNITLLGTLNTAWTTLYPQSQDPSVATQAIVHSMHDTHASCVDLLHAVFNDIPESALTEADRSTLDWPLSDEVRTRRNAATIAPQISVAIKGHLIMDIVHTNPDSGKHAPPDGQKLRIQRYVGNEGLAANAIPFGDSEQFGRNPHHSLFTEDDMKKTAYFRAYYISDRGEKGPMGSVVSAVVA